MKTYIVKIYFLLTLVVFFEGYTYAQDAQGLTFGGNSTDMGCSICLSPEGGYALVGTTRGNSNGANKYYFILLDSAGQVLQEKNYGLSNQDILRRVIPYQLGYIMVGDGYNYWPWLYDSYFMKTDKYGNDLFSTYLQQNGWDNGFDVLPTEDANFLILGHSRVVNPKGDISLSKIDDQGNEFWTKYFYEDFNIYAFQIIKSTDSQGYVMIGSKYGFFDVLHAEFQTHDADILFIKVDNNGEEIWRKTYGESQHDFGNSVCQAQDGGYYLFGSSQSYGSGSFDMLLIKTDAEGNEQWHKSFGGTSFEYGMSVAITSDNNLYLLGSSKSFGMDGSVDVYVVKTDADGVELWSETIGGSENDFGESLVVTPDSGCAIIGGTESFGNGGRDMYFLKLKSNGTIEVLKAYSPLVTTNEIDVFPNPMISSSTFYIHNSIIKSVVFNLFDSNGKIVKREKYSGNTFAIKRRSLKSGIYFFNIVSQDDTKLIFKGKLIVN